MIDIHTHLLPGVDDGSPSIEASLPVLERFAAEGVEMVVCTPHLNASAVADAPYDRHVEILAELRAAAPPGIRLELGWEIMLDAPGVRLDDSRLTLAGSRAVLVEFPRAFLPPRTDDELARIRASGVVPVVAHPERYHGCTPDTVRGWRRVGAVMQLDSAALASGGRMGELARALLSAGLFDVLASDTHGDRRSMATARDWLLELGAEEQAGLLTRTNVERVLAGTPPIPVAPVATSRGLVTRLREMLLGGRRPNRPF